MASTVESVFEGAPHALREVRTFSRAEVGREVSSEIHQSAGERVGKLASLRACTKQKSG